MPARKHRQGAALEDWQARKDRNTQQAVNARLRVQSLTGHILLRPGEVAAMLGGITRKAVREMELRGQLPPRVSFSAKVFGWRLADIEALVRDRMVIGTPAQAEEAA